MFPWGMVETQSQVMRDCQPFFGDDSPWRPAQGNRGDEMLSMRRLVFSARVASFQYAINTHGPTRLNPTRNGHIKP